MTKIYGLLGKHLGHSFSKSYFTEKFHSEKIDAVFENFELPRIEDFPALIQSQTALAGMSVTIPYKEAVIPFLYGLTLRAELIGAVNAIEFRNGKLFGHNTDVLGFRDALSESYEGMPGGTALILGTGGASKAVHYALQHYFAFEQILYVSRKPEGSHQIGYAQLDHAILKNVKLVVNTTPLGMFPAVDAMPLLPTDLLPNDAHVFDLIYNPVETKLLQAAKAHGCTIQNGMVMLLRQADAAWAIWNS